jgi:YD repeat-containing protein
VTDERRRAGASEQGDRLSYFVPGPQGRLAAVRVPDPRGGAPIKHRAFGYNEAGDLVRVTDALGEHWTFDYDGHLLVQETDRTGLSFYFQYDGRGPAAWCVRTWGDGGIYDHEIDYDKYNKITTVTDSNLRVTRYDMSVDGLVVAIQAPNGGVTRYEHDERSFQVTAEIDPLGRATRRTYDDRGSLTSVTFRVAGPASRIVRMNPRKLTQAYSMLNLQDDLVPPILGRGMTRRGTVGPTADSDENGA